MTRIGSRSPDSTTEESPYAVEHEYDADTPASTAVVQAICVLENIDPMEMPADDRFVLHNHIDPTALDRILGNGTGSGELVVTFEISSKNTYGVTIRDDGHITVQYGHTT